MRVETPDSILPTQDRLCELSMYDSRLPSGENPGAV